jgi:acetyl-CoA carboxylase beta subunit
MGVVVGEKVAIIGEYALEHNLPLILVAASGGARMHEGALSLMQMAKSCAMLAKFDTAGRLYVSLLANPTTGGVTASWATQADVVLAEPGALIGFAGPRVIKTTLRQDLPEGFQRSEFLIQKGQIDAIVQRSEVRDTIFNIMEFCLPMNDGRRRKPARPKAAPVKKEEPPAEEAPPEQEEPPVMQGDAPIVDAVTEPPPKDKAQPKKKPAKNRRKKAEEDQAAEMA